jgi:hypothetical protein
MKWIIGCPLAAVVALLLLMALGLWLLPTDSLTWAP